MAPIAPRDMGQWINAYSRSSIDPALPPPSSAALVAQACRLHVCSDPPRSLESARLLDLPSHGLVEPVFRELKLPYGHWPVPRYDPKTWVTAFRKHRFGSVFIKLYEKAGRILRWTAIAIC